MIIVGKDGSPNAADKKKKSFLNIKTVLFSTKHLLGTLIHCGQNAIVRNFKNYIQV